MRGHVRVSVLHTAEFKDTQDELSKVLAKLSSLQAAYEETLCELDEREAELEEQAGKLAGVVRENAELTARLAETSSECNRKYTELDEFQLELQLVVKELDEGHAADIDELTQLHEREVRALRCAHVADILALEELVEEQEKVIAVASGITGTYKQTAVAGEKDLSRPRSGTGSQASDEGYRSEPETLGAEPKDLP